MNHAPLTLIRNRDLAPLTTFGAAARAAYYCAAHSAETLRALLADPRLTDLPRFVLGGGSNVLFTRDFPGAVAHVCLRGKRVVARDARATYVEAAAGENWHDFVLWTLEQGLAGLENLSLIPGLVGASPMQNIGAYGVEMKDVFHELSAIDVRTGESRRFDAQDCRFAYRDSAFKRELKDRYIITSVTFALPNEARLHLDYGEVRAELQHMGITQPNARDVSNAVIAIRRRKLPDPAVIGNAGSFFKNPVVPLWVAAQLKANHPQLPHYRAGEGERKLAAGWLIEQAGWKGKRLGGAGVHEHHALVLVNHGGATGAQILELARAIQDSVKDKFGIELQPEPVIV